MVFWDADGQLCFEEVDEDLLALQMRSVPKLVPETVFEQNEWLQMELQQSQLMHRSNVECVQAMLLQRDTQNQADFRAMTAELDKEMWTGIGDVQKDVA